MTEREAFILAICEQPEDVAPRLIFADWLEEHGETNYAEFIRVQVALAEMDERGEGVQPEDGHTCWEHPCPICAIIDRYEALCRREQEFFNSIVPTWHVFPAAIQSWRWRRGFVEVIVCACADWLQYGPQIVRAQPVLEVTLSTKAPTEYGTGVGLEDGFWRWSDGSRRYGDRYEDAPADMDHDELPGCLWQVYMRLVEPWEHPSCEDAHAALSRVSLAWARGPHKGLEALPMLVGTT